jgi:predicted DNA binding CopG/RHH family protein
MTPDHRDKLLQQDWSSVWDELTPAPELVARPKNAQVTLRIPAGLMRRIKRIAAAQALPYHPLVRSWLVEGLRDPAAPDVTLLDAPQDEQLNIKLSQETLDEIKTRGAAVRRPYHRLAREWVESAVGREETRLGLEPSRSTSPATKDLLMLVLHTRNSRGEAAVRGITRLQKLLFVIEQSLAESGGAFYAFDYGPFDEGVNDAAEALRLAGFLRGSQPTSGGPPSFDEMLATAATRSGPRDKPEIGEFALNDRGHTIVERLTQEQPAFAQLFETVQELRKEWDTPDLVERVYEKWPEYTERSRIRDEVAARRKRRSK